MSWQASAWAKRTKGHGTAMEKLVLLLLSEAADDETWECWPSQGTLADQCGCHVRTVQRALDALQRNGFVTVVRRGNQYRSTRYRVNGAARFNRLDALANDNMSHATPVSSEHDTGVALTDQEPSGLLAEKQLRSVV